MLVYKNYVSLLDESLSVTTLAKGWHNGVQEVESSYML